MNQANSTEQALIGRLGVSIDQARVLLAAVGEFVVDRLSHGETVHLPHLGLFYMEWREVGGVSEWVPRLKAAPGALSHIQRELARHAKAAIFDAHDDGWSAPKPEAQMQETQE